MDAYNKTKVHEIYPEFWVIKTGKFSGRVKDKLDEWVYFLKNAEIKPTFSARGLKAASEKLDEMKLPEKERAAYNTYKNHLMSIASRNHTIEIDAKEIIKKAKNEGKEEEQVNTIAKLHGKNESAEEISDLLDLPIQRINEVIETLKQA